MRLIHYPSNHLICSVVINTRESTGWPFKTDSAKLRVSVSTGYVAFKDQKEMRRSVAFNWLNNIINLTVEGYEVDKNRAFHPHYHILL